MSKPGTSADWQAVANEVLSGKRVPETDSEREALIIGLRGLGGDCAKAAERLESGKKKASK